MNGRNKRWLEHRWDKRQPDRLAHIEKKKEARMKPDIHVNVAEITPAAQFQLARGCLELYHSILEMPDGREKLDAWKAAYPYKGKEKSK